MHRDEPHLGAVAEHGQHEGEPDDLGGEVPGPAEELRVEQLVGAAEDRAPRVVHDDGGQQRDAESHRRDEHVLPGRLGGAVGVVDGHQQRRDDGGDLDRHPQQRQPVDEGGHGHRPGEEVETGEEPAAVARRRVGVAGRPDVAHGEDRRGRIEERHRHQEHHRQRVDSQPPRSCRGGARRHEQDGQDKGEHPARHRDQPADLDRRPPADDADRERDDQDDEEIPAHVYPRSRSSDVGGEGLGAPVMDPHQHPEDDHRH